MSFTKFFNVMVYFHYSVDCWVQGSRSRCSTHQVVQAVRCLSYALSKVIGPSCQVASYFKFLYGKERVVMVSGGDEIPYRYLKSDFHRTAELVTAPVCTAKSSYIRSTPCYHAVHPKSTVLSFFFFGTTGTQCKWCNWLMVCKNFSTPKRAQNQFGVEHLNVYSA